MPRALRPLVVICILAFGAPIGFAQAFSQPARGGKQVHYEKRGEWFSSQGTRCFGWLWLPGEHAGPPPVVIMAHGYGAQMDFGLPAFAERFVNAGLAVFMFDYRNFGKSEGEPRNLVSPKRHLQDWEAALAFVKGLKEVDPSRIALWGSSFAGGHVIVTAAKHPGIKAVVAQVPFVDGFSTARKMGLGYVFKGTGYYILDALRVITFTKPYYVPLVNDPGKFGIMNTPESKPGYLAIVPKNTSWKNEAPARCLVPTVFYRPIAKAKKVESPALLIPAEKDSLIDLKAVKKTAKRMPNAKLIEVPCGHFDVYSGEMFEKVVKAETEFLSQHLQQEK